MAERAPAYKPRDPMTVCGSATGFPLLRLAEYGYTANPSLGWLAVAVQLCQLSLSFYFQDR